MLDINEAMERILGSVRPLGVEKVDILESGGRVLGQEVYADSDVPYNDNSAMDGYAVIAADVSGSSDSSPVELEVLEEIPAGSVPSREVVAGKASRIMTGAPMPDGANAVVMVEYTEKEGDRVRIKAPVGEGANIRRAGEDIQRGQLLFSPGRQLKPADIGVLSSAGLSEVEVGRRPVVGIITTGDEIVEPSEPAGRGRVRNSNGYTLYSLCASCGAVPKFFGIVPDAREKLEKVFAEAAETCDVIITSGGVSVGDFDLVKTVIEEMGSVDFWRVRMKPGKPLAFGAMGGRPLFGLPGNPVSVMVNFEMFVRPLLLSMMGAREFQRKRTTGKLEHEYTEKPTRTKIIRGVASRTRDGLTVRTTGMQGSGILMSMVLANCFFVMPEGLKKLKKDDVVEIIPLDNFPV